MLDEGSKVIEAEAIDTGDLLESGEIQESKSEILEVIVAWTARHAAPVHFGSKPHWPPFKPIREWVERNFRAIKVFDPFEMKAGRKYLVKPLLKAGTTKGSKAEKDRIAYAIQAKIAKEGTDPVPFATRGAAVAATQATKLVRDGINASLKRLSRRRST